MHIGTLNFTLFVMDCQSWHYHRLLGDAREVVHSGFHLVVDDFWEVILGNCPLNASGKQLGQ